MGPSDSAPGARDGTLGLCPWRPRWGPRTLAPAMGPSDSAPAEAPAPADLAHARNMVPDSHFQVDLKGHCCKLAALAGASDTPRGGGGGVPSAETLRRHRPLPLRKQHGCINHLASCRPMVSSVSASCWRA
ncbi:hypothetical protein FKM82_017316 [Ascaphus truei]